MTLRQVDSMPLSHTPTYDGGPQGMPIPPLLYLYKLRRQQWLKPEDLKELQRKKLIALISYAYRNVSYYKRLFDSVGIKPDDIKTVEDLSKIPITERQVLQELSSSDITAKNTDLRKCKKILTSGSSGSPLMVYRTRREDNLLDTVWARASLEDGTSIWDKTADYHSFTRIPKRWFEHFGVWRRVMIPTLEDSKRKARMIQRARPNIIRANPYELVSLAMTVLQEDITGINPRLVFAMGSLLDQQSRTFIESVLHTKVFDYYGSTELGCVAWECTERQGYHINIDTVVVEGVDDEGARAGTEKRGKLVCTGLLAYTMPFIRYEIGDIGIQTDQACRCGRGLPLMKSLEGRADDFLVSADGVPISPSIIVNEIKSVPGIRQFRIVQESMTDVEAQLVLNENARSGTDRDVKVVLRNIMGSGIDIRVENLDAIPADSTGKIRAVVSKVKKSS